MAIAGSIPTFKKKINLLFSYPALFFSFIEKRFNSDPKHPRIYNYDKVWRRILNEEPRSEKAIPCAFTDWDNSSRVGKRAIIFRGSTPEKFGKYLSLLIKRTKVKYKKEFLFLNAWNEWAEGAYLEPDEKYGFGYLEAVKDALTENIDVSKSITNNSGSDGEQLC